MIVNVLSNVFVGKILPYPTVTNTYKTKYIEAIYLTKIDSLSIPKAVTQF